MLTSKNPALGNVTQSRTALAVFAATLLVGGSVTKPQPDPIATITISHRHHHHASKPRRQLLARCQRFVLTVVGRRPELLGHGLLLRQ